MIPNEVNKVRFNKLTKERILQIMRDGVPLIYYQSDYPKAFYYTYQGNQSSKLNEMIKQDKYALQICNKHGAPLAKLQTSAIYTQDHLNKLCINSETKFPVNKFYHAEIYYIAKFNPTNKIHKSIYSQSGQYFKGHEEIPSKHIVDYIQGLDQDIINPSPLEFSYQPDLNLKQNEAIYKAGLNSISFIKGPPGCGKTKTIGRLCRLFLQRQKTVLVGCVSNIGILSITKQIIEQISYYNDHQRILQVAQHTRLQTEGLQAYFASQQFTMISQLKFIYFTSLLSLADYNKLDPFLRFYSINAYLIRNISLISRDFISIKQIVYKLQQLKNKVDVGKRFMCIYMLAFAKTIKEAHIVITTTVTAASINDRIQPAEHFRPFVAILDEASQASFADTLCYLKFDVQKLILVGDENQLDPTVISNDKLLKETVFSNMCLQNLNYFTMLNIQYRMHPEIAQIPNLLFYSNEIQNGVSSQQRSSEIQYFRHNAVSFINHPYQEIEYIQANDLGKKKNYYNLYEIRIIQEKLELFTKEQLQNVGIITPYGAQLHYISLVFQEDIAKYGLTVKTCDGYQGGQKDYIFVSCVRSNEAGKIGFCGQRNRVNVTISRAKRGLLVIGNAATLSAEQTIWKDIIQFLNVKGKCYDYGRQISELQIHKKLMIQNNSKYLPSVEQPSSIGNIGNIGNTKVDTQQTNNNANNGNNGSKKIEPERQLPEQLISKPDKPVKLQTPNDTTQKTKQSLNIRLLAKLSTIKQHLLSNPKQESEDLLQLNNDILKQVRKTLSNNLKKGKRYNQTQFHSQLLQSLQPSSSSSTSTSLLFQPTSIHLRFTHQAIQSLTTILQGQAKQINLKQRMIGQLSTFNPSTYQYNHLIQTQTITKIVQLYLLSKII